MDAINFEHALALIGSVTTLATLLSPALHWIAERTATEADNEAVRLLDKLLALAGKLGWHQPKVPKS